MKLEFKRFELDEKEKFQDYFYRNNVEICEFSFVNLFSWGEIYKIEHADISGRTVIGNRVDNAVYMPFPYDYTPEYMVELSDITIEAGYSGDVMFGDRNFVLSHYDELSRFFRIRKAPEDADYIYKTQMLAELQGRKLHKKRNLISQFLRKYPDYSLRPMTSDDKEPACALSRDWCRERVCDNMRFSYEMSALSRLFDNFDSLGVEGIMLFVAEELVAFSVFSQLNPDMYDIHFEKFRIDYKGAAQVINKETAVYLKDKCDFINREQDMGIPGLRKNKRSYLPEYQVETYYLERKRGA